MTQSKWLAPAHDPSRIRRRLVRNCIRYLDLYLLLIPPLVVLIVFRYIPMYGVTLAFRDFKVSRGILGSPWAGMKYFLELFRTPKFFQVFTNTLLINIYRLVWQFPIPILIAIMIYDVRNVPFKRMVQTISYMPHFFSWVIIAAMFFDILAPRTGIINKILAALVGAEPRMWMGEPHYFRSIVVISNAWKESGWGAIVYLAAMMAIDPQLYEAAVIDGAGKFRQMWHITLPGIAPTIVFIIMIRLGAILGSDMEQIMLLSTPATLPTGDVLSYYVYRMGIGRMQFSFATAAGLFTSVIGFLLLVSANYLSVKIGQRGLF
ncbi:MAG: ABC transporter permease [Christensenellales bacterium]|jgi:putative aldouronate transport system permease protein